MITSALYTAQATTTGGRVGSSTTDDGRLAVRLDTPKGLGGAGGEGTNPEQLFAVGYSACFLSAIKSVARQQKLALPDSTEVSASVSIGQLATGKGFGLAVELDVAIPGLPREEAQALVDGAHEICPYSNATRGNIEVKLTVREPALRTLAAAL